MRKILTTLAASAALGAATTGQAVTTTTTFVVSATVVKTCSVSAGALAFTNYTPGGGAVTNSSTVNVNCTKTTPFTVALNGGTTTGGTVAQRLMASGTNTLEYNLFTTNTYGTVFGDGSGTSVTQSGAGAGVATAVPFTVYGQLPDSANNKNAVPGAYTDTITVTVTY
jgi:spore coat protein U-like protein